MARGPKKHLKRLCAPKSWMLDKLGGVYAPRPSTGPHKLRECLPLIILLRNKLKYALSGAEVTKITMQRLIKVDNKIRTDPIIPQVLWMLLVSRKQMNILEFCTMLKVVLSSIESLMRKQSTSFAR
ncbi:UNVERIFIED_CONTAM: hypothetical protein RMT77_006830 [Armadillidium vulgare]